MREHTRMRHFWEKGSAIYGKEPEAFFAQVENVFANTNKKSKALERVTNPRHQVGQPWHEHLLSAGGNSPTDDAKISYLKNSFSNPARLYTAAVAKTSDCEQEMGKGKEQGVRANYYGNHTNPRFHHREQGGRRWGYSDGPDTYRR